MYADFSGITDIAIGIGLLFGIRGPENFNRPYFATNLQDFWRRWHMSLTSWLTDYLFVPLRMTFRNLGNVGLSLAIFLNMVAVGVWHGPRWTYLVFGCINGVYMIVSALTLKKRNQFFKTRTVLSRWRAWVAPLVTFHLVVFTHIFFQAPDLQSALSYLGQMLHLGPHGPVAATRLDLASFGLTYGRLFQALAGLVVMETIHWAMSQPDWAQRFTTTRREFRWVLYYAVIVMVMLSARGTMSFIYAKF
jgi:D-alanyl-lipoteichoic acid acyltransferase DltB (MBOAT superfamily)